jgi:hypothetical protein
LPPEDYSLKWDDYHTIALALSSDSFFKQNAKEVWDSIYRVWHHQLRFVFWMYAVLAVQITTWTLLLKNYARLKPYFPYMWVSNLIVGRVSEWHVLLTTFLWHPSEKRTVYADIVTQDGLYQGRVRTYFTDKDGALAGILLDETSRYRIRELLDARKDWQQDKSKGEEPDTRKFWTKIKGGTHLYIPAGQIGNLNVRYEMPRASVKEGILKSFHEIEVLMELISKLRTKSQTLTVTLGRPAPPVEPPPAPPAEPPPASPAEPPPAPQLPSPGSVRDSEP